MAMGATILLRNNDDDGGDDYNRIYEIVYIMRSVGTLIVIGTEYLLCGVVSAAIRLRYVGL